MRTLSAVLVAALATAGAALAIEPPQPPVPAGTTPSPAQASGLFGFVSRGPVRPLCRVTQPCYRPARVTLQFRLAGRPTVLAVTRATGAYRVSLAPGVYTVWTRLVGLERLKPSLVRVPAAGFHRVDFVLGSGIY